MPVTVAGDGFVDVPIDGTYQTQERKMEMDPLIAASLNQGFAVATNLITQSAARFNTGSELTANEAARMFQLETQLVGALAAARLDKSATADKVLELRSTAGQPQLDSANVK